MAITLTRIAKYPGNVAEAVASFDSGMRHLPRSNGKAKYGFYDPERQALVILSHADPQRHSDYDTLLTITSESDETNVDVVREFHKKTRMKLKRAPPSLEKTMEGISACFPIFKRLGNKAFDILTEA